MSRIHPKDSVSPHPLLSRMLPRHCLNCRRRIRYPKSPLCATCEPPSQPLAAGCTRCGEASGESLCSGCQLFPPIPTLVRSVWYYRDQVQECLRTMKYRASLALCRYLATQGAAMLPELFDELSWDSIVPIPTSFKSFHTRGFHVTAEIVQVLSHTYSLLSTSPLIKARRVSPQVLLAPAQRMRNVRNAFACTTSLKNRRILLVDDVLTTGATINHAALALYQAGATKVDVFTLARSPNWTEMRRKLFLSTKRASTIPTHDSDHQDHRKVPTTR